MIDLIAHPFAMMLYGLLSNLVMVLAQRSNEKGAPVNPVRYVMAHPWTCSAQVLGALAGFGALHSVGEATAIASFGAGYMGSDVLDKLGSAAGNRFSRV